ncbi:MAG: hypothetical protein HY657_01350 [Acidobacteria bacterium]|nr:hypothetical protein [Acidobacteriota bacterium]
MARPIPAIELRMDDLDRLVDRTRVAPLTDEEHAQLKAAITTLGYVAELLEQKGTTITGLRQLLFGAQTEKTRDVLARAGVVDPRPAASTSDTPAGEASEPQGPARRRGHGRHAAAAYAARRTSLSRTRRCITGTAAPSA